jgi:hypothetical protein
MCPRPVFLVVPKLGGRAILPQVHAITGDLREKAKEAWEPGQALDYRSQSSSHFARTPKTPKLQVTASTSSDFEEKFPRKRPK